MNRGVTRIAVNTPSAEAVSEADIVAACVELAQQLGLGLVHPVVIGRFSNIVVHLAPTPWVARVATGTAGPRSDPAWARREIAIARALAEAGAPVGAPAPGVWAGPHGVRGWRITLWQWLALQTAVPAPQAAGRALAQCHQVLAQLPAGLAGETLQAWSPLEEAARLLDEPRVLQVLGQEAGWLSARLVALRERLAAHPAPLHWLHGDAHLNNVRLNSAGSPVWLDWEDACRAPLAWDVAGLVAAGRVLQRDAAWAEAALQGWQQVLPAVEPELLDLCIEARTLFVAVWSAWLGGAVLARLPHRLAWLHQQAR